MMAIRASLAGSRADLRERRLRGLGPEPSSDANRVREVDSGRRRACSDRNAEPRSMLVYRIGCLAAGAVAALPGTGRDLGWAGEASGEARKIRSALASPSGSSQWTKWAQVSKRITSQFSSN